MIYLVIDLNVLCFQMWLYHKRVSIKRYMESDTDKNISLLLNEGLIYFKLQNKFYVKNENVCWEGKFLFYYSYHFRAKKRYNRSFKRYIFCIFFKINQKEINIDLFKLYRTIVIQIKNSQVIFLLFKNIDKNYKVLFFNAKQTIINISFLWMSLFLTITINVLQCKVFTMSNAFKLHR